MRRPPTLIRFFSSFFVSSLIAVTLLPTGFVLASDDLSVFLKSSGYGAAAGAVVGLASLALSENPDSKINNVARGASIGLYAGIIFGLSSIQSRPPAIRSDDGTSFWISPLFHSTHAQTSFEGLGLNWAILYY